MIPTPDVELDQLLQNLPEHASGERMRPVYERGATIAQLAAATSWGDSTARSKLVRANTTLVEETFMTRGFTNSGSSLNLPRKQEICPMHIWQSE